jgi:hypothetical protein
MTDNENDSDDESCKDPEQFVDNGPHPVPINLPITKPVELIKPDSLAMFVRVWDRNSNSCSRTDLQFKFIPNCKYLKYKNKTKDDIHVNKVCMCIGT